ncbi:hypothetical protein pb186bvf_004922 [Paramecium bursaria]
MTMIYINEDLIEDEGLDIEGFKERISQLGEEHTYSKYINFEDQIGTKPKDINDQSKPIYFFTYKSLELVFHKLKKCQEENIILFSQNQSYEFNQEQLFEMTRQELAFHNGLSEPSCEKCLKQQEIKDCLERMKLIYIKKQSENEYLLGRNKILEIENELKNNVCILRNYLFQIKNCQSLKQLEEELKETKQQNLELETLKTMLTRQNLELRNNIQAQGLYDETEQIQQLRQKQNKTINKCIQCEKVIKTFEKLIQSNEELKQQIQLEKSINQKIYDILYNFDQQYFKIVENKNSLEKQVIEIIQKISPFQNNVLKNIGQKLTEFVEQNEKIYTELERVRQLNGNRSNSSNKQIEIRKQVI